MPGVGLLLLRVAVGVGALVPAIDASAGPGPSTWPSLLAGAVSSMLLGGLLTPLSSLTLAALGVASVVGLQPSPPNGPGGLLAPLTALAVALLGPGAYSLDARLFGRREIVVSHAPRR